jgi:putative ABC transport system permease protein
LTPYVNEALFALESGIPAAVIDRAGKDFGMPMGPIELTDVVGLDVSLHVGRVLADALQRQIPEVLIKLVEQKKLGRMERPLNNQLYNVAQWLDFNRVVQKDNRVLIGISMLFLAACLVNVVGLLLSKFLNGAPLTGLRRALGASRRDIVRQHMAEVLLVCLGGGALGVALAAIGLAGVRALYGPNIESIKRLTQMDATVVLAALRLSIAAGIAAGLYPAWRIGRTSPAIYLKSQ